MYFPITFDHVAAIIKFAWRLSLKNVAQFVQMHWFLQFEQEKLIEGDKFYWRKPELLHKAMVCLQVILINMAGQRCQWDTF